jgi:hypothetical protein
VAVVVEQQVEIMVLLVPVVAVVTVQVSLVKTPVELHLRNPLSH